MSTSARTVGALWGIPLNGGVTQTVDDTPFVEVIFTHLHFHRVTRRDLDEMLAQLSRDIGQHDVPIRKLHPKHGSGQHLLDFAFYLNDIVGHTRG